MKSLFRSSANRAVALACAAATLLLCISGCGCQHEESASGSDSSHLDAGDARVQDLLVPDASPPDSGLPDVTHYDFCSEPFFKLPIDSKTETIIGHDIWEHWFVFARGWVPQYVYSDVYLFDLEGCNEHRITRDYKAGCPSIWDGKIIWTETKMYHPEPDFYGTDLFGFDMAQWKELRITQDPTAELDAVTNGTHVSVIKAEEASAGTNDYQLLLMNLETGDQTVLAPSWAAVPYHDTGERYVVWSGFSGTSESVGRDIFYHDLVTGLTDRVEYSTQHFTYTLHVSENHLVYRGSDVYMGSTNFLVLFDIETKQHEILTQEDLATPGGQIHRNLVAFATSKYSGTGIPADIEMYDIGSGLSRRLTTRESNLRPAGIYFPYLLVVDAMYQSDPNMNDWYVANLVALGITDLEGNLQPGGGVIEPPR